MGNHTISKAERLFLREEILKKYCRLIGLRYEEFESNLTGTLGNYEKISDVIADYVDEESNFGPYVESLSEQPLKISLRKIVQGREEDRKRFLRDLKTYASANVLRKLLFYGAADEQMSFKEDFITACYYYLKVDRTDLLRKMPIPGKPAAEARKVKPGTADTISPIRTDQHQGDSGGTIPAFGRKPGFSLRFLKDSDEIDESRNALKFTGAATPLNRENLEPDNLTITSKVQAEIRLIDGQWYIENKSQLKTTYIQVLSPVQLNKGDIIIMGNTRFLFEG